MIVSLSPEGNQAWSKLGFSRLINLQRLMHFAFLCPILELCAVVRLSPKFVREQKVHSRCQSARMITVAQMSSFLRKRSKKYFWRVYNLTNTIANPYYIIWIHTSDISWHVYKTCLCLYNLYDNDRFLKMTLKIQTCFCLQWFFLQ